MCRAADRTLGGVTTVELALISIFSALWIASQATLGPLIGQITQVHGVIQRLLGWLLMLILAELTQKFGRVTLMTAIAALATRMVRRSASLYPWVLASGYALGGLFFDIFFFIPIVRAVNLEGKAKMGYVLTASLISGIVALIPYIIFQFYTLDLHLFTARLPIYAYSMSKGVGLNLLGTLIGVSIIPKIKDVIPNIIKRTR